MSLKKHIIINKYKKNLSEEAFSSYVKIFGNLFCLTIGSYLFNNFNYKTRYWLNCNFIKGFLKI